MRLFRQARQLAEAKHRFIERSEFLAVSPMRYLLLQRLNNARAALRRADPTTVGVAEIARKHQFRELGRFAVTYRTTFGESPSATLHQNPQSDWRSD
jgi:transcriptional regulator GlxA family with amidase domain